MNATASSRLLARLPAVAALALLGCARGRAPMRAPDAHPRLVAQHDTVGPPVVEVRAFPGSSTVSVVGWAEGDVGFGLRSWIRRDGVLVNDAHRFYVGTNAVMDWRIYMRMTALPGRVLLMTGRERDPEACSAGLHCVPFETFGARVPDATLRAQRDSLTVELFARNHGADTLVLHRDLLVAYLRTVDSVRAALRNR